MKILEVKRRNPLACAFTIEHFRVTVEDDNGNVKKLNCWAGREDASVESLMYDISAKTRSDIFGRYLRGEHIEGVEKAELVVEGKTVHQVNGNIVLHVNTQQNADAIAQKLRDQAQVQSRTGIRYGK